MFKKLLTGLILATTVLSGAASAERLFSVETSGLFFKDKIHVEAFDDPTIDGISCYINLPDRSMNWDDQSDTALACRQVGPITPTKIVNGKEVNLLTHKTNVFKHSKGIFFKHMRVDRHWDAKRNVMVYISYTKKASGDNASSGLSVVPVKL